MATCQKCGGEIQGWTCQGCGQVFRENDAGALVFATMEAVAWREKLAVVEAIQAFYLIDWNRLDAEELADAILQALAVIPTHGLGSSATPIPTELSDTAVVAEKEPDQ